MTVLLDALNKEALYNTRTEAAASFVPSGRVTLRTNGLIVVGDGGDAVYSRATGFTPGGFQSADGAWWKLETTHGVSSGGAQSRENAWYEFATESVGVGFDTRAIAAASWVHINKNSLVTNGLAAAGDGGGSVYYRVLGSAPGGFQSGDGAWWAPVIQTSDLAFGTRTAAAAALIPAIRSSLRTNGYYAEGDGGGAFYIRGAGPTLGGFQSADGAWWELVPDRNFNIKQFGAVGDGVSSSVARYITATSDGTNVLTTASTTGLVNGMNIAAVSWSSGGVIFPIGTTVVSFVVNTSITVSNAIPANAGMALVVWSHTVTGTDNLSAIQSALDYAMQEGITDIYFPRGSYAYNGVINAGWGNTYYELHLIGEDRNNYAGGVGTGAVLLPIAVNQPALNFQGMRTASIKGIMISGRGAIFAEYSQWFNSKLSSVALDWLDPTLHVTGNDPGGLAMKAPYAGITIDAYGGAQPAGHYPDRVFPAWTGIAAQYGSNLSSDVLIEDCGIKGFAVQVVVGLNTVDQGDFVKLNRVQINSGVYGFSIGNTQSRNIQFSNMNTAGFHTLLSGTNLGLQVGELVGPIDNVSTGGLYQIFDFSNMGFSGPLHINNLYSENVVRIGNFTATNSTAYHVNFNGGAITLGQVHGQIPASYITSGQFGSITFNNTGLLASTRIGNMLIGRGNLTINNGQMIGAIASGTTAALQRAVNYCGGILAGDSRFGSARVDRLSVRGKMLGTYYESVGAALGTLSHSDEISFSSSAGDLSRAPMTQCAKTYVDWRQHRQWRMTILPEVTIIMTDAGYVPTAPSYVGDVMSFGYAAAFQTHPTPGYRLEAGDMLYVENTGTIFVVTAVGAPNAGIYPVDTQQQNNIKVTYPAGAWESNINPVPTLAGNTVIIKTGIVIPRQLMYATFNAANGNLASVSKGDGVGSDFSTYYAVGDLFMGLTYTATPYQQWPVVPGSRLTNVTNGSPGSGVLGATSLIAGVYPLFPYELR